MELLMKNFCKKIITIFIITSLMSAPSREIIAVPTDLVDAAGSDSNWLYWGGGAVALGVGGYFLKRAYDYLTGWTPNQVLVTLSWNNHTKVVDIKMELFTKALSNDLARKKIDPWDVVPKNINQDEESYQPAKQLKSQWNAEPQRINVYENINRDQDLYRGAKQLKPALLASQIKQPGSYFLINSAKFDVKTTKIYAKTSDDFYKAYKAIARYLIRNHNNHYVFQFLIPLDLYKDLMQEKELIYLNFSNYDGLTTSLSPRTWVSSEEKASGLLGDKRHKVRIDLEHLKQKALDCYDKLIVPYLTEFSVRLYNPSDKIDDAPYVQSISNLEETIKIITNFLNAREKNTVKKRYDIEFGISMPLFELWKMKQK